MSDKFTAAGTLAVARGLLGAFHRIRTSLEKNRHLDAEEIGKVLIRSRDEIRMAVELPAVARTSETGISKNSMRIWIEGQLRLTMELLNDIEDDASFRADPNREASANEIKMLKALGFAVVTMLNSSTFDATVAPTVQ